jgi:hypothetical protein
MLATYLHEIDCPEHIAEASLARHAARVDAQIEAFWRDVVGHEQHMGGEAFIFLADRQKPVGQDLRCQGRNG